MPRLILQLVTGQGEAEAEEEAGAASWRASWRKSNPEYTHMLWREADWDAFVAAHGGPRERRAYAALRPPEPKAALLRLLFLREVGGVCPAAGTEIGTPLRRLLPPRATALLGDTWREWQHLATLGDTWWFELLVFAPRHPVIVAALDAASEDVLSQRGPQGRASPGECVDALTFPAAYARAFIRFALQLNCTHLSFAPMRTGPFHSQPEDGATLFTREQDCASSTSEAKTMMAASVRSLRGHITRWPPTQSFGSNSEKCWPIVLYGAL